MAVVIWDVWVTIDVDTCYLQVICNVFEERRQRHSRPGNQWGNISIVKIIQLKLFNMKEYLQSTLKSVD